MRAKKGGQTGMNGEHYDGGQFLPNTTLGKMNRAQHKSEHKPRKCEVAPYQWEVAPEGKTSIYAMFAGYFGKVIDGQMIILATDDRLYATYGSRAYAAELARRWNAGERWIDIGWRL